MRMDIVKIITDAAADYATTIGSVMAAGIGLAVIIWGGKKAWRTFKGVSN